MARAAITAVGSALAGAVLVAAAAMVAAWAGLAAYDVDAARLWSQEISAALRIGPAFADEALGHVEAIAIAAAALALTGLASFHDAWRATRDAANLDAPRLGPFVFAMVSGTLLMLSGVALAAWTAVAVSEPDNAIGIASVAAGIVPMARSLAEYSMENLVTAAAFAMFLLLCGWLELRSARAPSWSAPFDAETEAAPVVAQPMVASVAPDLPQVAHAAPAPATTVSRPAEEAFVRVDTEGVIAIEQALGRIGVSGLGLRQKTALAALTPEQQFKLAKWLNWCAAHRKTSFAILAVVVVELLGMINKLAS